jgi:hypothetical protein
MNMPRLVDLLRVALAGNRIDYLLEASESKDEGNILREKQWLAESVEVIKRAYGNLRRVQDGETKPSEEALTQIVNELRQGFRMLSTRTTSGDNLKIGEYRISEIKKCGFNNQVDLDTALRQVIANSQNSFTIYRLYPFVDRNRNRQPVNGSTLEGDSVYNDISHLTGDKLKTAILEIMLDQLSKTDASDFHDIKDDITGSPAYAILHTSQSKLGTMSFFTGKTSSQRVIDRLIAQRAETLGVPLDRPAQAPANS